MPSAPSQCLKGQSAQHCLLSQALASGHVSLSATATFPLPNHPLHRSWAGLGAKQAKSPALLWVLWLATASPLSHCTPAWCVLPEPVPQQEPLP